MQTTHHCVDFLQHLVRSFKPALHTRQALLRCTSSTRGCARYRTNGLLVGRLVVKVLHDVAHCRSCNGSAASRRSRPCCHRAVAQRSSTTNILRWSHPATHCGRANTEWTAKRLETGTTLLLKALYWGRGSPPMITHQYKTVTK